jgi:hypothetical protein
MEISGDAIVKKKRAKFCFSCVHSVMPGMYTQAKGFNMKQFSILVKERFWTNSSSVCIDARLAFGERAQEMTFDDEIHMLPALGHGVVEFE